MTAILIAAAVIAVPAAAFVAWPLLRPGSRGAVLALPPDEREQLLEAKAAALRALRELAFEHEAGHVSDADYADLKVRYEADAASSITALDRLGVAERPAAAREPRAEPATAPRRGWRHPLAIGASAVALVGFGLLLGVGIVRYSEPDRMAGTASVGAAPMADSGVPPMMGAGGGAPMAGGGAGGGVVGPPPNMQVTPEILQGMLNAARSAMEAGQYPQAIAAYQAIIKRDPKNVDAITNLGLIVAMGGHADAALEAFDKALAIKPNYPLALLYRGHVLLEGKNDPKGAVRAWEQFLKVTDSAEDRQHVQKLIADARGRSSGAKP
jgi:tetratricopeptide (TPR) repeat protein